MIESAVSPPKQTSGSRTGVLAVFDFDGTLIRGDSFLPFLIGYACSHRRLRPLVTLPAWLLLYIVRLLSDELTKQRVLISFFRGQSRTSVDEYTSRFCEKWVRSRLHEPVLDSLNRHLAAGHRVVLLSASPDLYMKAVGRMLNIDEVVCTRVRGTTACWDGALEGPNCKGEQKLVRLRTHLASDTWNGESYAYGDSKSDLPVLQWVTHGYLVGRRGELQRVEPINKPTPTTGLM